MNNIKGYIVDVDGTIYSQKKLRLKMLYTLLKYYIVRPNRLKELKALYLFRKLKERSTLKHAGFNEIYGFIESKIHMSKRNIARTIQYWMFCVPIRYLKNFAYNDVVMFLNNQHHSGKKIIVWSDYPAIDKLKAIGLEYDRVYAFGETDVYEQKPSKQIIEKIIIDSQCDMKQLIYIGDRDDRDRTSAELVNMHYCDIIKFRKMLHKY